MIDPPRPKRFIARAACLMPRKTPLGQHVEGVVPLFHFDVPDRTERSAYASVVEHDIDPAEIGNRQRDHRGDVGLFGDIGANEADRLAESAFCRQRHRLHPRILVVIGDDDRCAFIKKAQRGRTAHPARAAGDNCHFVLESHAWKPRYAVLSPLSCVSPVPRRDQVKPQRPADRLKSVNK
jgi:hypothetical protein